eukprot:TRINITY_DN5381_c0_g1_i2.p1 TRINITY_DN5381_c0_g1~~TRINITY_DN5381_c0_g1_i2.p1  ORF type:complete len:263 (-),score=57.87 TRINITY_DN5381_c0_g1_i2:39-827(-)
MEIDSLFSVKNKVVLVTGGGRGIGLMIATSFVKNNAKVYITSRTKKTCDEVAKRLTEQGPGTCHSLPADLSQPEELKKLVEELKKREKALHVLVNNSGSNWNQEIEKYTESAWDKVMDLNVKSVFFLTRELLPLLVAGGLDEDPARVINIGSVNGIQPPMFETYAYSTSKAALHHLSKVLASQLAKRRITVNAIAAGPFQSKMMKETLEKFGEVIKDEIPLKRIGSPEDIGGICLFLSSRAGAYVTGAIIPLEGGLLVRASL